MKKCDHKNSKGRKDCRKNAEVFTKKGAYCVEHTPMILSNETITVKIMGKIP